MKTKAAIIIIACLVAVISLCAADSTSPASAGDVAALKTELHHAQAQLARAVARISALEKQVRALQKANAELRREMRRLRGWKPQEPRWYFPPTNGVPPLTPLRTNGLGGLKLRTP